MKKHRIKKQVVIIGVLCLCFLAACGRRPAAPENMGISETQQVQEIVLESEWVAVEEMETITEEPVVEIGDQIYSEEILQGDFPIVKPEKEFSLQVYAGGVNFLLYVDDNGVIQEAEPETDDHIGIFENLEVIGKPYEEGFVNMLEAISAKDYFPQVEEMGLIFVSHEAENARWLMENGIRMTSEYLNANDQTHIKILAWVVVYLKDSSSDVYNFLEKYRPKNYEEIKKWFVEYQGDYTTEEVKVSSSRDSNGNLVRINIIGGYYGFNLYWVPGTEVYKLRASVEGERDTAIYWPDGKIDTFIGEKGMRTKIPGEISGSVVYLPDAEIDECGEAMALMDQYRDTAVNRDEDRDYLYILRDDGDTRIIQYHEGNKITITNESADTRYKESYTFEDQQISSRSQSILDEYLRCIYSYREEPEEISEYTIDFEECIEVRTKHNKTTGETQIFKNKMIRDGNTYTWYRVRWENDREIHEYEYVSKDSRVLKTFTGTDKRNGEVYYWELDGEDPGENEYANHVVRLTRTLNGVSRTYSVNQIPWGSGMIYPPHRYHEFIGGTTTYELDEQK